MTSSIQEVAQRSPQQASEGAGAASRQADTARANIGSLSTSISDLGSSVLGAVQAMQQLEENPAGRFGAHGDPQHCRADQPAGAQRRHRAARR